MTQLSKSNFKTLYGSSGSLFPDNSTGDISEADIRAFGEDIADTFLTSTDGIVSSDDRKMYDLVWVDTTGATGNQDRTLFDSVTDAIISVYARVIGIKNDGSQGYYAEKSATFRKDGSATATQVGTTTTIVEHKDDAETSSIAMNSTNVRVSFSSGDTDVYRWTIFATVTQTKL